MEGRTARSSDPSASYFIYFPKAVSTCLQCKTLLPILWIDFTDAMCCSSNPLRS